MANPAALAVLVALTSATSLSAPADRPEPALHLPKLVLHAPATVPAFPSPQLKRNDLAARQPVEDVDVTGPVN